MVGKTPTITYCHRWVKLIIPESQQCLDLVVEVSDLRNEVLMEFVPQLTVLNHFIDKNYFTSSSFSR